MLRTKVGSPFVIAGMQEAQAQGARAIIGFEANGGLLLGSDIMRGGRILKALPTRDAMLPILAALALAAEAKQTLSRLAQEARFAIALSNRLQDIPQERTASLIDRLDAEDAAFREAAFAAHGGVAARDRRDGLRLTLGDGATVHFRASGNAPELRVYVEAADQLAAERLLQDNLALCGGADRVGLIGLGAGLTASAGPSIDKRALRRPLPAPF